MVILNQNEQKEINSIIELHKALDSLYIQLFNLKKGNSTDKEKLKEILEYISLTKETITNKYSKSSFSYDKCQRFISYLEGLCAKKGISWNYFLNQNFDDRVYKRLILFFQDIIECSKSISIESEYDDDPLESIFELERLNKEYEQYIDLNTSLKNDLLRSFIKFLENALAKSQNADIKANLLKVKLTAIFLNADIENEYILENYESSKYLYLSNNFLLNEQEFSYKIYNQIKKEYWFKHYEFQKRVLSEIPQYDSKIRFKTKRVITQSILSALALIQGKDIIISEIDNIEQYMYEHNSYPRNLLFVLKALHNSLDELNNLNKIKKKVKKQNK